jgi:hypothetical protein
MIIIENNTKSIEQLNIKGEYSFKKAKHEYIDHGPK